MVPPAPEIDLLVSWLEGQSSGEVFHTDSLVSQYPQAHGYSDVASGLLAVRLDRQFSHYILWFREEQIRSIPWAGDPNISLVVDASGPRIEPRRSFARWMLEQRGYSLPWSVIETDAAHTLSMTLIEVLTQKALNLSEQNYRLLAENSTDMIVRLDRHGIISFVSPSSTEVIGYPPGELVGNSCLQFVAQQDRRDLRRAMISIIRNVISRTLLFRLNCRDGKQIWLESTIKPVANQNGRPFEVVANSRDVTLRHEYQLAIESLQRRKERRLPRAGLANDPDDFARVDLQVDPTLLTSSVRPMWTKLFLTSDAMTIGEVLKGGTGSAEPSVVASTTKAAPANSNCR